MSNAQYVTIGQKLERFFMLAEWPQRMRRSLWVSLSLVSFARQFERLAGPELLGGLRRGFRDSLCRASGRVSRRISS